MCTAISFQGKDFYFGRTLDLEWSLNEKVVITPRSYPFSFRFLPPIHRHHALIGVAHVADGYPLYYEAVNEKGLGMAGLNFPGSAKYQQQSQTLDNVATFELIPWVLSQCATLGEARALLQRVNPVGLAFNPELPASPLHWMIASREGALVMESTKDGVQLYDNPVGVMTNEPPFPYQMLNLTNYLNVSHCPPENRFAPNLDLKPYSRGMGGIGLPGDLSSASRFVRAAFTKLNSVFDPESEESCVSQFFHIMGSVAQQRGCVELEGGKLEVTVYTSCCNADKGIYYYSTYENPQLTAIRLDHVDLDAQTLTAYPLLRQMRVFEQN